MGTEAQSEGVAIAGKLAEMSRRAETAARCAVALCQGRVEAHGVSVAAGRRCDQLTCDVYAALQASPASVLDRVDSFTLVTGARDVVVALNSVVVILERFPQNPPLRGVANVASLLQDACCRMSLVLGGLGRNQPLNVAALSSLSRMIEDLGGSHSAGRVETDARRRVVQKQVLEQLLLAGTLIDRMASTLDALGERRARALAN